MPKPAETPPNSFGTVLRPTKTYRKCIFVVEACQNSFGPCQNPRYLIPGVFGMLFGGMLYRKVFGGVPCLPTGLRPDHWGGGRGTQVAGQQGAPPATCTLRGRGQPRPPCRYCGQAACRSRRRSRCVGRTLGKVMPARIPLPQQQRPAMTRDGQRWPRRGTPLISSQWGVVGSFEYGGN